MESSSDQLGEDVPALANKPVCYIWHDQYLKPFDTLSRSRSLGFSQNPLYLSEIIGYGKFLEIDDMPVFIYYMQLLDGAYLSFIVNKMDKKK